MTARCRRLLVCIACCGCFAARADDAKPPLSTAYDGSWWIALSCEDTKDRRGLVKGYDFQFPAQIRDGRLDGRQGVEDQPSSVHLTGEVRDGGALEIRADGMTGTGDYTIGHLARGTPYGYTMVGHLDERSGEAKRREVRPCRATFTRR